MPSELFTSTKPQLPNLEITFKALDLGCGDRVIFHDGKIAERAFGADIAPEKNGVPVVTCKGESLPFGDYSFDLVTARVALPYMHIPSALREIHRILLPPTGRLWGTLHLPRMAWKRIFRSIQRFDLVDVAYQLCAILNCWLLSITDFQISWRGRYESVQTPRSMRNALRRAGFEHIKTEIVTDQSGLRHFAILANASDRGGTVWDPIVLDRFRADASQS